MSVRDTPNHKMKSRLSASWPQRRGQMLGRNNHVLLEYHLEGKRHRYTPDVLVAWGSHQEVIEIKEDLERQTQRAICVGGRAVVAAQIPNRSASENLALRHQIGVLPFRDDDPKLLAARALANYRKNRRFFSSPFLQLRRQICHPCYSLR